MENQHLEQFSEQTGSSSGKYIAKFLFFLVFSLGTMTAYLVYFVCFILAKWKPRFTFLVIFVISSLLAAYSYFLVELPENLLEWRRWIEPYILANLVLGMWGGFAVILWNDRIIKKHPEIKMITGWRHNFAYKKTPFESWQKNRMIRACQEGNLADLNCATIGVLDDEIILNDDERYGKNQYISRYYDEAMKSTLITGATGSGKTITMLNLIRNDIIAGYPVCVVDFKKGPDVVYFLSKWAKENNRKFYHFTSGRVGMYKNPFCEHQASYDPLAVGSATSKADMILNLRKWDTNSDLYKNRTKTVLEILFYLIETVDRKVLPKIPWDDGGLAQITAALQVPNLHDMIEQVKKDMRTREITSGDKRRLQQLIEFYQGISTNRNTVYREQIEELIGICRTLILSSYSDWLFKGETPNHINLLDVAVDKSAPVVLFQFNPNEETDSARVLGSIILADLGRVSAVKNAKGDKNPFGLYVDEFQTLDPKTVSDLLAKTRSSGFFNTLSLQSLEQISKASEKNGEVVLASILDTINNFIVHSGSGEDTARRFSKIVGQTKKREYLIAKDDKTKYSFNFIGKPKERIGIKETEEYKLLPRAFQELSSPNKENGYKATAYYITKECSEPELSGKSQVIARKFHAVSCLDALEEVPQSFKDGLFASQDKQAEYTRRKVKELEEIQDEDIFQDNLFKIEKIEDGTAEQTLDGFLEKDILQDPELEESVRIIEEIESKQKQEKKITTFDQMMKAKQSKPVEPAKKKSGLPTLPDL